MIQSTLLLVFHGAFWCLHPFHLSICELEYDADNKSLQITSRLFQDDLEISLNQIRSVNNYFSEVDDTVIKEDLKEFFKKHLQVSIDENLRPIQFLGFEIEDNVVWCYLEISKVKSIREISIKYSPLIDTFDNQINLAHIRYQGKVKSLKFQRNQLTGTAIFTN